MYFLPVIKQVLASALGNQNNGMLALEDALLQRLEEPLFALEYKGTSGTSVKLTSWLATVAPAAIKPAYLPMILTTEIPFCTLCASVCAQLIALAASLTAVT